jgi:hypothetical protein
MPCPNVTVCSCPNVNCERHARCCACVLFHRDERGNLPTCVRHLVKQEEEKK